MGYALWFIKVVWLMDAGYSNWLIMARIKHWRILFNKNHVKNHFDFENKREKGQIWSFLTSV